MSISDRVCPEHGDIGALPSDSFCSRCGKKLEMKGILRSSAEAVIPGVVLGAAVGAGVEIGQHIANSAIDGISDFLS